LQFFWQEEHPLDEALTVDFVEQQLLMPAEAAH
jgi:hypothetical protein